MPVRKITTALSVELHYEYDGEKSQEEVKKYIQFILKGLITRASLNMELSGDDLDLILISKSTSVNSYFNS